MIKDIRNREIFHNCFVCSQTNPQGLKYKIEYKDGATYMEFLPKQYMEGLPGLMHGGFSMMMMDEVMLGAVTSVKIDSVSLNVNCDFISKAVLTHRLAAEGKVETIDGRKIYTTGRLWDLDTGKDVIRATGLYYNVDMDSFLPDDSEDD